jgi:hypothetical protein
LTHQIYQVVAELTLKEKVMLFIHTHSMAMPSTNLNHALATLSYVASSRRSFVINLNCSSWCNYFRPEVQHALCKELDIFLGFG